MFLFLVSNKGDQTLASGDIPLYGADQFVVKIAEFAPYLEHLHSHDRKHEL